jgi:hypothetical protein
MTDTVPVLPTLDELGKFVRRTLCQHDNLDPDQTAFFRTPMVRGGRVTGFVFHVEGPRLLRTSAVWAVDDGRLVFYDSTGQKVRAVELPDTRPDPEIEQSRSKRVA